SLQERGARVEVGSHNPAWADWAELVVPSPGIPPSNPLIRGALERGVPVWSEVELAWRRGEAPVIAVTGTNGKTTTTLLVADILRAAGVGALAAGNIGLPLSKAVRSAREGVIVCEVSSFQLAFTDRFRPEVALVLNVAHDHYDWHAGYEDYVRAKARITHAQGPQDLLIVASGDPGATAIARGSEARLGVFGCAPLDRVLAEAAGELSRDVWAAAGVEGERLVAARTGGGRISVMDIADIRLLGPHNLENVLAATLATLEWGVPAEAIARAVGAFEGLAHRTTPVAEVEGVRYIDDSKATNPHATLRALDSFDRVVLLAGGRAKGLDLAVLRQGAERIKAMVVMGEAASEIQAIFSDLVPVRHAATVEDAVTLARSLASPGDTVLLSPACASWDQYSSYAERGARFIAAVRALDWADPHLPANEARSRPTAALSPEPPEGAAR
ncbi:MAG: UDP-N-acetylmuramoyl-L-alanine--D-glutamate ligase, partial [Actinomycetota bacterium]